ncbi:hypothetical protein B0H13DRAFT_1852556 [Mycena leptocephala]|nr:hypothetical protein B0H13DRAFT_1852556 [Mycena leptocephala]
MATSALNPSSNQDFGKQPIFQFELTVHPVDDIADRTSLQILESTKASAPSPSKNIFLQVHQPEISVHASQHGLAADPGPAPALDPVDRLRHSYYQTTAGTKAAPPSWFLGSNLEKDSEVFGSPGDYHATFWYPVEYTTAHKYGQDYADGSYAIFTTWPARLKLQLSPNAPLATGQRHSPIMPVVVGVAHEVGGQLCRSVVSRIVGLGRRMEEKNEKEPASFLYQIRSRLASPEMTIQISPKEGRIVFGRGPGYTPHAGLGNTWKTDIRVLGRSGWIIASETRSINGEPTPNLSRRAEFDTDHSGYYLVHKDLQAKPEVDLDLSGYPFRLENIYDPTSKRCDPFGDGQDYRRSSQSRLLAVKVTLFNMELNLKFPPKGGHTVSWRWKSARVVAPQDSDWGI